MITETDMIDLIKVYDEITNLEEGLSILSGVPAFGGGSSPIYLVEDVIWRNCGTGYRLPEGYTEEVLYARHKAFKEVLDSGSSAEERCNMLLSGVQNGDAS